LVRNFEEVWFDILKVVRGREKISTICRGIKNIIVKVTPEEIIIRSELSKKGTLRKLRKEDFEYVWEKLVKQGVYGLDDVRGIIGKRAIVCAILSLLNYVEGNCVNGRVNLRLRE